jgi:hypothetical protein
MESEEIHVGEIRRSMWEESRPYSNSMDPFQLHVHQTSPNSLFPFKTNLTVRLHLAGSHNEVVGRSREAALV